MGLERITIERAEGLIKITNDLDNAKYFTITPSTDPQQASEGWESVTYYSDKKRTYQIPTNVPNAQWVYVLSNTSMPGMVKIGYTNGDPDGRVKEINRATGIPTDFVVEYALPCVNGYEVEQLVHEALDDVRVNNRKEFFNINIEEAKHLIDEIGKPYVIHN
jgi:hypothetical protein